MILRSHLIALNRVMVEILKTTNSLIARAGSFAISVLESARARSSNMQLAYVYVLGIQSFAYFCMRIWPATPSKASLS